MVVGLTFDLLAILAGAFGMLCLLVGLFGRAAPIAPYAGPFDEEEGGSGPGQPFIPMPKHLRTHAEMVAWMTQELPKLTEQTIHRSQGD